LRVFGDEGALTIDLDKSYDQMDVCLGKHRHKTTWKTMKCPKTPSMHDRFFKSIRTGVQDQPDFEQGAAIQEVLDACVESDADGKTVHVGKR